MFTPSWSAPSPLKAIDTTQQSARLRLYAPDPLSGGRNKFEFQLVVIATRPLGGSTLPIERRLFPADELLRGFAHGTISPWSRDPANSDPGLQLQPAGADTVLGASSEYRVPLVGPVSGAAFVDFGWIGLGRRNLDPPATIVTETNNLLRASTGAELRVMIPGLRQPARLIFAWNPLRLNTRTLADPARSIRFALGNVF